MKAILLHIVFGFFSVISLAYIEKIREESKIISKESSIATNVSMKVYGEGGREWELMGEELLSFGQEIKMKRVRIRSESGYVIKAEDLTFRKDRNTAFLSGSVEIRGEALFVKTERAFADLNKSIVRGDREVKVWKGRNYIEGVGFTANLRPLKVIISGAKAKHEM